MLGTTGLAFSYAINGPHLLVTSKAIFFLEASSDLVSVHFIPVFFMFL